MRSFFVSVFFSFFFLRNWTKFYGICFRMQLAYFIFCFHIFLPKKRKKVFYGFTVMLLEYKVQRQSNNIWTKLSKAADLKRAKHMKYVILWILPEMLLQH